MIARAFAFVWLGSTIWWHTRPRILLLAAVGMLIWLYSRYTLLAIVSAYVLHGLVLRFLSLFRFRQTNEAR